MSSLIEKFLRSEKGAETLEYIVIAAVIIIIGAAAYTTAGISGLITGTFDELSNVVGNATTAAGG